MLAISEKDWDLYGCPNCGCDTSIQGNITDYLTQFATCENCKLEYMILSNHIDKSTIGIKANNYPNTPTEYPKVIKHPRKDIPKWKYQWPDPRPEGGGEYFSPRSIGYDLAGFVKSKEAGERIIEWVKELFPYKNFKTWLDYRSSEPKWIQVKFNPDEFDLSKLHALTTNTGIITQKILEECKL